MTSIAIDLTSLADNFSGIERYAANMTLALLDQLHEHDVTLVFKREVHDLFRGSDFGSNVTMLVIPEGMGGKLRSSQITLPRVLSKLRADLNLFLAFPAPLLFKGPSVSAIHDMCCYDCPETMTAKSRILWRALVKHAAKTSQRIIAVSQFSKSRIVDVLGVPEDMVCVAYNGVNRTQFHPKGLTANEAQAFREKFNLPTSFILSLSTVEPRKNLSLLVGAWADLYTQGVINQDLVLAGRKGWKTDGLLEGLPNEIVAHVHFTGFVEEADLPILYGICDLFVFPSIYEGFGLPPVEAYECGANVLCSDIPCLKEICGEAASYFRSCDADNLKERLVAAQTSGFERHNLPQIYDWSVQAACIASLLRRENAE